jgi:NAD(P)-dependent dehydrogenase (short-subunit alcohol dehydrogenase family)
VNIDGAVALVTGAGSGIGAACASVLAGAGANTFLIDRDEPKVGAIADALGAKYAVADVASEAEMTAAINSARAIGPIRVLVNAAGISSSRRMVDRSSRPMPLSDFEQIVRVNLVGSFNCARICAAVMAEQALVDGENTRGVIVNLSSIAAFDGQVGQVAYAASKAGVLGMTLPMARDLAVIGVRVNTIAPGLIDTPIYGEGEAAEAFKAQLATSVLYPKRLGVGTEIASMVLELIRNDYMNAETIRVDGGIRLPAK